MDQKKIGEFFKQLRKEKNLTQEQLAEKLGVSGRTVSRWETGRNMPDFSILLEIAKFYGVTVGELLKGERQEEEITKKDIEEAAVNIAGFQNDDQTRYTRKVHGISLAAIVLYAAALMLQQYTKTENIASFFSGASAGLLIIIWAFSGRHIKKLHEFKMKLLRKK